jgi:chromosome segregation ATPase
MNPPDQPCQATPARYLRQQILDSRVPKNEREWWASREIEKLERELAAEKEAHVSQQRVAIAAKAECERLRFLAGPSAMSDDSVVSAYAELARLRAELASKAACYDIACGEVQRLRAEVERLKGEVTDWELAFQEQYARAEKAEAELTAANKRLADCEFLSQHRYKIIQRQEPRCNEAAARAEKAEAECVRLKSLGSWAHTCVHHNDAERKAAMCCPVCEQTRSQKIETALKDAISTYFGDDKLVTAERIEAWQAALKDNK